MIAKCNLINLIINIFHLLIIMNPKSKMIQLVANLVKMGHQIQLSINSMLRIIHRLRTKKI
jgi:hypothetical protein